MSRSRDRNLISILVLCLVRSLVVMGAGICYDRSGNEATGLVPCEPNATVSGCCQPGSTCYSNGLCALPPGNNFQAPYYFLGCTDPTLKDSKCMSWCTIGQGIQSCGRSLYCCYGYTNCDCNNAAQVYSLPPGTVVSTIATSSSTTSTSSLTSTTTPTASSTTVSSTSTSASASGPTAASSAGATTAVNESSSSRSNAMPIGVGVGVGVAVVIVGVIAVVWFRRRRRNRQAHGVATNLSPGPAVTQCPPFPMNNDTKISEFYSKETPQAHTGERYELDHHHHQSSPNQWRGPGRYGQHELPS